MTCSLSGTVLTCRGEGTLASQQGKTEFQSAASIVIEEGITATAPLCFSGFSQVASITFPVSLEVIEDRLISTCKVKTLYIPENVRSISAANPFDEIATLEQIKVSEKNKYYKDIDGVLYSKNLKTLHCIPSSFKEKTYALPYGVKTLGFASVVRNEILETLVLPPTVKEDKGQFVLSCALKNLIVMRFKSSPDPIKFGSEAFLESQITESDVKYPLVDNPITCPKKPFFNINLRFANIFLFFIK